MSDPAAKLKTAAVRFPHFPAQNRHWLNRSWFARALVSRMRTCHDPPIAVAALLSEFFSRLCLPAPPARRRRCSRTGIRSIGGSSLNSIPSPFPAVAAPRNARACSAARCNSITTSASNSFSRAARTARCNRAAAVLGIRPPIPWAPRHNAAIQANEENRIIFQLPDLHAIELLRVVRMGVPVHFTHSMTLKSSISARNPTAREPTRL